MYNEKIDKDFETDEESKTYFNSVTDYVSFFIRHKYSRLTGRMRSLYLGVFPQKLLEIAIESKRHPKMAFCLETIQFMYDCSAIGRAVIDDILGCASAQCFNEPVYDEDDDVMCENGTIAFNSFLNSLKRNSLVNSAIYDGKIDLDTYDLSLILLFTLFRVQSYIPVIDYKEPDTFFTCVEEVVFQLPRPMFTSSILKLVHTAYHNDLVKHVNSIVSRVIEYMGDTTVYRFDDSEDNWIKSTTVKAIEIGKKSFAKLGIII